jgi:hypothetical protein
MKASCNKKCKKNIMEKRASEEGGIDATKTLDYGRVCMDQHKETLEVMMGHVQQPPPSPFNYKDICWWNEYYVTHNMVWMAHAFKRRFMWHIFQGT